MRVVNIPDFSLVEHWTTRVFTEFRKHGVHRLTSFDSEIGKSKIQGAAKALRDFQKERTKMLGGLLLKNAYRPKATIDSGLITDQEKRKELRIQYLKEEKLLKATIEEITARYTTQRQQHRVSNMLRLFNWKVWIQRYGFDLDFIVTSFLEYYPNHRGRYRRATDFTTSIQSLTNDSARDFLVAKFVRQCPNYKEEQINRLATRMLQNTMGDWPKANRFATPEKYLEAYRVWVYEKQRKAARSGAERFRRPFRGNPFR